MKKNNLNLTKIRNITKELVFDPKKSGPMKVVSDLADTQYCLDSARMKLAEMKDSKITKEALSSSIQLLILARALLEEETKEPEEKSIGFIRP